MQKCCMRKQLRKEIQKLLWILGLWLKKELLVKRTRKGHMNSTKKKAASMGNPDILIVLSTTESNHFQTS